MYTLAQLKNFVSVPYRGATFLNAKYDDDGDFDLEFPSPIGELHFSIKINKACEDAIKVSVPYRGATFLNFDKGYILGKVEGMVSVPYRGATFLNN